MRTPQGSQSSWAPSFTNAPTPCVEERSTEEHGQGVAGSWRRRCWSWSMSAVADSRGWSTN
eukprot:7400711-Pyramimonas_sp.AAC.1